MSKNAITKWLIHASFFCVLVSQAAPQTSNNEYVIKALFLTRFCTFIDWPATSDSITATDDFVIGILGENPFGNILEEVVGRERIKNREVKVINLTTVADAHNCDVVFVNKDSDTEVKEFLHEIANQPVLVVDNSARRVTEGVHIGLKLVDQRVRFDINRKAIAEAHLNVDFRLLQLADNVIQ